MCVFARACVCVGVLYILLPQQRRTLTHLKPSAGVDSSRGAVVDCRLRRLLYPCQPADCYEHVVDEVNRDDVCDALRMHTHYSEHAGANLSEGERRRGEEGKREERRREERRGEERREERGGEGRRMEEREGEGMRGEERKGEKGGEGRRAEEEGTRGDHVLLLFIPLSHFISNSLHSSVR